MTDRFISLQKLESSIICLSDQRVGRIIFLKITETVGHHEQNGHFTITTRFSPKFYRYIGQNICRQLNSSDTSRWVDPVLGSGSRASLEMIFPQLRDSQSEEPIPVSGNVVTPRGRLHFERAEHSRERFQVLACQAQLYNNFRRKCTQDFTCFSGTSKPVWEIYTTLLENGSFFLTATFPFLLLVRKIQTNEAQFDGLGGQMCT